jgi:hypothetical protein
LGIHGTQSECVVGLVAGAAGSSVRAETLKEWTTQIDAPGIAVCPGKTGEIEKWKQIAKINVGNRGARGEDD